VKEPISLKDTRKFRSLATQEKEYPMAEAKTYIAPSLLQPDNHAVLLIDYQYLQLVTACSHNPQGVIAAATLLARGAKLFNVPTFLTTGLAERQGLVREVAAVFPDQTPVDRTTLNSFEDPRVVEWVRKTGKKKLVMGGLWTESCLLMASLSALHAGYEVYIVVDASSSGSLDSHNAAVQRMVQAGCIPIAAGTYLKELQRDWSRTDTAGKVREIYTKEGTAYGQAVRWELDLLKLD
jgi:nicotinamidase-related amidase